MHYLLSPYNYDLSDPGSIPNLIWQHAFLVGVSMLISLIIAIPVGILVARRQRLYIAVITFADFLYTIPGLALLGVLITIPGLGLSFQTAIIPLILYTQLVLIRNTAAAINGIDPLLIETAKAMGMTRQQTLFRVSLPLALPVIIAGIRVATVTTIGIASLASLVNEGGLGDLIFKNIDSRDFDAVTAGGILMALFAIVADLVLLGIQTLLNRGRSTVSVA
ncbi:MAG TPA: ABC transporter permease [Ktedonobacteraceae bacterium]|nr:ABC transporter permease [Ktedonobacteraceae bacterium]